MSGILEALQALGSVLAQAGCRGGFEVRLPPSAMSGVELEVMLKCNPPPFQSMEEYRQQEELRRQWREHDGLSKLQIWTAAGPVNVRPMEKP